MDELDRKLVEISDALGGAVNALHKAVGPGTDHQIRLECLRLAVGEGHDHGEAGPTVARARAYADFVLATNDGEVIAAARALAEKVR